MVHTGNIIGIIHEAQETLLMAETYMNKLGKEFETLKRQKLSDRQIKEYIELLLPLEKTTSLVTAKNVKKLRDDLRARYYDAPDLQDVGGNNAYRFINAVSDFATHNEPLRRTTYYNEYKRRYGVTLNSSLYDVHHIKPLAYGVDNSFSNLIHLPKSIHKTVTSWFSGY